MTKTKEHALICVNEIIKEINEIIKDKTNPDRVMGEYFVSKIESWQSVKKELESK